MTSTTACHNIDLVCIHGSGENGSFCGYSIIMIIIDVTINYHYC